jgi:hypothetical protein
VHLMKAPHSGMWQPYQRLAAHTLTPSERAGNTASLLWIVNATRMHDGACLKFAFRHEQHLFILSQHINLEKFCKRSLKHGRCKSVELQMRFQRHKPDNSQSLEQERQTGITWYWDALVQPLLQCKGNK